MIKTENKKIIWFERFESFFVEGGDARRFLNGITTTNINLGKNFIQTCWLTPKGILRALLEVHFYKEKLLLIVLEGNIREIKDFLEEMIFPSDKVLLSENFLVSRIQEIKNNISWRNSEPKIFVKTDPKYYCEENQLQLCEANHLEEWKIRQAIPKLNNEIDGINNPLELGLYDLIDFNKGCYLGQETMARLNKLASLKQEIRVCSAISPHENLKFDDKKIFLTKEKIKLTGYITNILVLHSGEIIGLAMIKKNYLSEKESFFNENLGKLKIQKSVGSNFF